MELTEKKLHNIITESINKVLLKEYHNQPRIPFPEFGNGHALIDEFIDWIQYSSEKGVLPKPTISWEDGLRRGYDEYVKKGKKDWKSYEEFRGFVKKWEDNGYIEFDENGNLYVERSITMPIPNGDINSEDTELYQNQIDKYEKNVGGCWAVGHNTSQAYCGDEYGETSIVFKGYMFLDDIYWLELPRLWSRFSPEYEVRTYPNGRVMLTGLQVGDKELGVESFDGPRILRSTFFGNKETFNGNYVKLGYEKAGYDKAFIDRQGNEYTKEEYFKIFRERLKEYRSIEELEEEFGSNVHVSGGYLRKSLIVNIYEQHYNYVNEYGTILFPGKWFDWCNDFNEGLAPVQVNGKFSFIDKTGELAFHNKWFDWCDFFFEGFAKVKLNGKEVYIDKTGEQAFPGKFFDECYRFEGGVARVVLNGKCNFIKSNGKLLCGEYSNTESWFDIVNTFHEGFAEVNLDDKWNFIDTNGELLWKKPFDEWFDWSNKFVNGFARVKINNKWNFIGTNGELVWKKPVGQWFDDCSNFFGSTANVILNGKDYKLDKNGNITKEIPQVSESLIRNVIRECIMKYIRMDMIK